MRVGEARAGQNLDCKTRPGDMTRRWTILILISGWTSLLSLGCAPKILAEKPHDWPETWRGRKLYNTETAIIYASSEAAALEAQRLADRSARRFVEETEKPSSRGLLLVTDHGDEPVLADFGELVDAMVKGVAADDVPMIEVDVGLETAATEAELAELNLRSAALLGIMPVPLDPEFTHRQLGFVPQATMQMGWIAAVPTTRFAAEVMNTLLSAALARPDIPLSAKAMILPMWPIVRLQLRSRIDSVRESILVLAQATGQPAGTERQKSALIHELRLTDEDDLADPADTNPHPSQTTATPDIQD